MKISFFLMIMIIVWSCGRTDKPEVDRDYLNAIDQWHSNRLQNLKKENGWLNLIGLYWLKPGRNLFGSDPANAVILPKDKAPAHAGVFILDRGKVTIEVTGDASVTFDGHRVTSMRLFTDADTNTSVLQMGSLRWFIIQRGDQFGVRLRDLDSPAIRAFKGVERFPVDPSWKFLARWEPYEPPRRLLVPTILGTMDTSECAGALVFEAEGATHRLEPIGKSTDESLFVIFGDKTNGKDTYGGGRYLYVNQADSTGHIVLDFNKAYNPPCVFTEFATCPFPPIQNKLPIAITAGEKMYGSH